MTLVPGGVGPMTIACLLARHADRLLPCAWAGGTRRAHRVSLDITDHRLQGRASRQCLEEVSDYVAAQPHLSKLVSIAIGDVQGMIYVRNPAKVAAQVSLPFEQEN